MENEVNEVVEPDVEIVVRAGEREVAIVGCFKVNDLTWDVVVGIDEADLRDDIRSALQLAIDAVSRANFSPVRSVGGAPGDSPPF